MSLWGTYSDTNLKQFAQQLYIADFANGELHPGHVGMNPGRFTVEKSQKL
jgi:hypothetical protein